MFISLYIRKSLVAGNLLAPGPFVMASASLAPAIACAVLISLLLIGLPVQAVMQKERITGYVWHMLPAIVFGGVLFTGVMALLNPLDSTIDLPDIIRGTGLGFISSTVAWLIRRPDLDVYDSVLAAMNVKQRMGRAGKPGAKPAQSRVAGPTQ